MKYPILFLSLLLMLVQSSCANGTSGEDKGVGNGSESGNMDGKEVVEAIESQREDSIKKPEEATPVDNSSEEKLLPLKPGFYVIGSDCEHPANAGWRYWNGQGLSGASTVSCSMKLIAHKGKEYTVSQTCINTYDKSASSSDLKLLIEHDKKFTLTEGDEVQVFKFCENTPSWINY